MAQGTSGGFNVTIRALDEVTGVAERIKRELKTLGEAAQPQVKATNSLFDTLGRGITETGRGITEIGHKAIEAGKSLGEAFRPIADLSGAGGLAAVASIGGITLALEKYASTGANLLRTSQAMGINVQTLQGFQQGAKLAGSDAGALTEGLDTLNQKLRGAAWGSDTGAIMAFKQLNIAVKGSNGEIRKAEDVLPEIAEAVKRNLIDPYVAADIAQKTLGPSAKALAPFLREGAEGIRRFIAEAEKYGAVLGPEAVEQTHRFERAQSELSLAITGVGNSIAKDVLPILTPATLKMAGYFNELRKSPEAMEAIEIGGAALATLFSVTLVAAVSKFAISVNSLWALPLFKFLRSPLVAPLAIGAGLGPLGMGINPIPKQAESPEEAAKNWRGNGRGQTFMEWLHGTPAPGSAAPQTPAPLPTPGRQPDGSYYAPIPPAPGSAAPQAPAAPSNLWDRLKSSIFGSAAHAAPMPGFNPAGSVVPANWQPEPYPNAPVESQQPISRPERNNPGNLRASDQNPWLGKVTPPGAAFESFDTLEHGVRARALTYQSYLKRGIDTIQKIAETSGPASDGNNIPSQIAAYKRALGGQYDQPGGENLPVTLTPENLRRLTSGGVSIEAGGGGQWLPKGVGQKVIDDAIRSIGRTGAASLAGYAVGNAVPGGLSPVTGLNPEFARRISSMVDAMPDDVRGRFNIISGFRSQERQAEVHPSVTNSHHSVMANGMPSGMAADTTWDQGVRDWIGRNGQKFGVGYTLADMPGEGNHLEPTEGGQRISPNEMTAWAAAQEAKARSLSPDPQAGGAPPVNLAGAAQNAAGDSKHQVEVSFANAPPGMRTGVKAQGDADFTLRTQHSLSSW